MSLERRALIAHLMLEVARVVREHHFANTKSSSDMFLLGAALIAADKPLTAGALARQAFLTRTTALRRLQTLCAGGFCEKVGTRYQVTPKVIPLKRATYLVNLVHETSVKLSKLDKNI